MRDLLNVAMSSLQCARDIELSNHEAVAPRCRGCRPPDEGDVCKAELI